MKTIMKIDLSKYDGPVFSGRDRGELIRSKIGLDSADNDPQTLIEVDVPANTYSVTSSFFLGLFGPSIVRAGSSEIFFVKFHFNATPTIKNRIFSFVSRALQDKALFN